MNFRDFELRHGRVYNPEGERSSLGDWYDAVREIPIDCLSVGDICRAIRQDVFVSEVLYIALNMLRVDVLAGDFYDGELIKALAGLEKSFWLGHVRELEEIVALLDMTLDGQGDREVLSDVLELIRILRDVKFGGR